MTDERRAAYLGAYDLFEAVQGDDHAGAAAAIEGAERRAEDNGWAEVGFVLAAARTAHLLTRPRLGGGASAAVKALLRRAEELDAPAFVAMALGLRALGAAASGDTRALLADAGRAVALLDDDEQPPLDRCTAYVVAAAAFNTLRLWELVDELYGSATDLAPQCDAPAQTAAIVVNRVLTRLESALALLETGDEQGSRAALERAAAAVPAALAETLPPLWRLDVEGCSDIVALLLGADPLQLGEGLAQHRAGLSAHDDVEVLPLLDAATALALWRSGHHAAAEDAAVVLAPAPSASSGARTFPLWVCGQVLSAQRPTPATAALQEHAALVSRLRWESRRVVLAAAEGQIALERQQTEHDRLARDVHTDALTGLLNRRSFDSWLQWSEDAHRRPRALMLVDLDDFKSVNDTHGHASGDEVLQRVALLMRGCVRFGDLALRHGGDEFAVLIEDEHVTAATALARAQELHAAIVAEPWSDIAAGLSVTASIGVALAEPTAPGAEPRAVADDASRIYRAADAALYEAKRSGTGVVLAGEAYPARSAPN